MLDVDRYLTFFAAEAVTSDMDGFSFHDNNSYMYRLPKSGRFIFIPHGADGSFWATGSQITRLSGPYHQPYSELGRKVRSAPALFEKYKGEVARVSRPPVWDEAALLARVEQVARILATAEKKPPTTFDLEKFARYRPIVEGFIRSQGTTQNGKAL